MDHLGYISCKADPDLWMHVSKRNTGEDNYEYMLLYVDGCLCVSEHAEKALREIYNYFPMKHGSIGPPKINLGAKLSKVDLPNGIRVWAISAR